MKWFNFLTIAVAVLSVAWVGYELIPAVSVAEVYPNVSNPGTA